MNTEYETDDLVLKVLKPDSAYEVLNFYEKNKYFFEPHEPDRGENFYSLQFHKANLQYEYEAMESGSYMRLWIFRKGGPDVPIGTFCFYNYVKGAFRFCTLGYKTDFYHAHKGIMYRALSYYIPVFMNETGMHRIEAFVSSKNTPSIGLLKKLGFKAEGTIHSYAYLNGAWKDFELYTLIGE
ncbi:MAG: GNAT family N-acetyltransferase [Lachnospiraceae bacterium]|nr:GNAT family N-acetyltransferase [Lachnospiraceae bacterium]MEE3460612.1 GNAT family N-acetyltransferase [Lachnospiraceae bacterium]